MEALELLKNQLSEKFIDQYEDLQTLFTTNCLLSELPTRSGNRSKMSFFDKEQIVSKTEYVLYPEYTDHQKSVALSPMRPHGLYLSDLDHKF